jgi:hypothetical protein
MKLERRTLLRLTGSAAAALFAAPVARAQDYPAHSVIIMMPFTLITFDNPPRDRLPDFVKSEMARWGKVVQRAGLAGTT